MLCHISTDLCCSWPSWARSKSSQWSADTVLSLGWAPSNPQRHWLPYWVAKGLLLHLYVQREGMANAHRKEILDSVPAVGPVVTPSAAAGLLQESTRNSAWAQSDPLGAALHLPAACRVGAPSASCCSSATGFERQIVYSIHYFI